MFLGLDAVLAEDDDAHDDEEPADDAGDQDDERDHWRHSSFAVSNVVLKQRSREYLHKNTHTSRKPGNLKIISEVCVYTGILQICL